MRRSKLGHLLALALFLAPAGSLAAQGWIEVAGATPAGRIEKVRGAVEVTITGRVARVTVEEWFRNAGPVVNEGAYLYALPGESVFSDFSLWQGDHELKGEVMDAAQARGIYEEIVRKRRDPALIELAGHGMIRARVFPINPGETRKITLRFTQLLDRVGDAWRFRFTKDPTAAPRSMHIDVDSATQVRDPYSPTHLLQLTRHDQHLEATLADSNANGEVELFLPFGNTRGLPGISVVTDRRPGEPDGYFMALIAPPAARQDAISWTARRDIIAVLDISGSMAGEKLRQAKSALLELLNSLHPGDRFRLIAFSTAVRALAPGWSAVDANSVAQAEEWVRGLEAEGGTNIAAALGEAFSTPPSEGALGVVVFLTDGLPTVGDADPEHIAESAEQTRHGFRVFTFGLGYDVNTFLLDRLAEKARGASEYVAPGADIERAVGELTAKIASPVLTDLALSADGAELYDVQPGNLPDLFAGEDLVVFGRYRNPDGEPWSLSMSGLRAGARPHLVTRVLESQAGANSYVAQIWASRKAGALSREVRLHGMNPELATELKDLALRYGILTEYTSYLVREPEVVAFERRPPMDVPAAPAPTAQYGAASVAKARRDAAAAGAATLNEAAAEDALRTESRGTRTERAGGKLFFLRDSVWTDLAHTTTLPVVTIAPFSDAYFALMGALPELVGPARLAPAVLVAGKHVSLQLANGGKETLGNGELERIVREFR